MVFVLTVLPAFNVFADDFRSGRSAYNRSDYAAALRHWLPLARRGHAKSQAALGYLYLKGLGVDRNYAVAAEWYGKAARQNQVDGLYFLGMMYLRGHGVAKDYRRAYALCDAALSRGMAAALRCREAAAQGMTANQIRKARPTNSDRHIRDDLN